MKKSILEKRVEEKAKERFEKEYKEFVDFVISHPIGKNLKIIINDDDFNLCYFGCNYALFNHEQDKNSSRIRTNYETVKKYFIEKYIKEETDDLLRKLENIKYLFEQ